jgi:hypothetical protein
LLAALAGKAEAHLVSIDGDMVILESGEAVAAVLFGVVVIAYADERGFQKMYDGRQHLFARQPSQAHVLLYFLPDRRQRTSKSDDVFVFSALPHLAKKSVIAILFASLRIASRRLNVTIGKSAYPHINPRRWDCQSLNPLQRVRFGQLRSVRTRVNKTGAGLFRGVFPAECQKIHFNPADSAASLGSTMVWTPSGESSNREAVLSGFAPKQRFQDKTVPRDRDG